MKNKEEKEFNYKRLFDEFMSYFIGYMGKEEIKKMFYANVYLIYLAKKYNIDLQECTAYDDYLRPYNSFREIIIKLNKIYEMLPSFTKEFRILKEIEVLLEDNIIEFKDEDELFKLMSKLTKDEIKEIFEMNSLELKNYSSKENVVAQKSIIELVDNILDIRKNDEVLDLCSGNGDFLVSVIKNKKQKLYGVDINENSALISKIRLSVLLEDNERIIVSDALTHDFRMEFDKVFFEYPFELKLDKYKLNHLNDNLFFKWRKAGLTADWMFLNKIATLLKSNGTAVLIITEAPLFKSIDIDCRRDLLVSGMVKCIIKLPSGILPYKNTSANLIILSKSNNRNKIKFIDATQEYIENNQKERELNVNSIMNLINGVSNDENEEKAKAEKISDICNTDDVLLTVNSYVKKNNPNYINPHLLKEYIVDKYRGYQFSSQELIEIENINGDYNLLNISDINDGIISNELLRIDGNNNKYDRYLLHDGDVIITSKGTKLKVVVADIKNRKIIPNGNLMVLRLDFNKIEPHYLEAFLNSENGRLALEKVQTGAKNISINPSKIEQMKISVIDIEEQKKFVEKYQRKMKDYILLQEELKKLKDEIDNLFKEEIEEKNNKN